MWKRLSPDPALDLMRDSIASASVDGEVKGHIWTTVSPGWTLIPWINRVELGSLYFRDLDGVVEFPPAEDYGPDWLYRAELREGFVGWHHRQKWVRYDIEWLEGDELDVMREAFEKSLKS